MREFSEDRMSLYMSPVVAAMVNLLGLDPLFESSSRPAGDIERDRDRG